MIGSPIFAGQTPSTYFQGEEIPVPPAQTQKWDTPKTELPPVVVDSISRLFADGLSDPRGCEYREIEVSIGNNTRVAGITTKTHGWVLPDQSKGTFAICWNGLVYPIVSVGNRADLHQDLAKTLAKDKEYLNSMSALFEEAERKLQSENKRTGKKDQPPTWPIRAKSPEGVLSEEEGIDFESMLPIKAALLLRLGETELAQKLWAQWFCNPGDHPELDPYQFLGTEWIWALFDHGVRAHVRGDDKLALVTLESVDSLWAKVAIEGQNHRIKAQRLAKPGLVYNLEPLPAFIWDQKRRKSESPGALKDGLSKPPSTESIDDLISDLQNVSGWLPEAQRSDDVIAYRPICRALVAQGDAAVEPLLKCFEHDHRLSRIIDFGDEEGRNRRVVTVSEVAYWTLKAILKSTPCASEFTGRRFAPHEIDEKQQLGARFRDCWKLYKGVQLDGQ